MEAVWLVSGDNKKDVKDKLFGDELVSRQSITLRDARSLDFNKDGSYIYISGASEALDKARKLIGDSAEEVEEDEMEEVIDRIEAAEENVASGLGGIFG